MYGLNRFESITVLPLLPNVFGHCVRKQIGILIKVAFQLNIKCKFCAEHTDTVLTKSVTSLHPAK